MPEFTGRLRTPRLSTAPQSPVVGEMYYDVDDNVLYFWNGTTWVTSAGQTGPTGATGPTGPAGSAPSLVTSLPGSPVDGQEIYYQADATNGVIWHLRYRTASASSYKWEFIGGSALHATVDTSQVTSSASYGDLATVGPSITLPLAGDYDVQVGAQCWHSVAGQDALMSYQVGATAAIDSDGIMNRAAVANSPLIHTSHLRRKTGLVASTALVAKYKTTGVQASYQVRFLRAFPVRVG